MGCDDHPMAQPAMGCNCSIGGIILELLRSKNYNDCILSTAIHFS
jgi:hypothetical protein